nr:MAG TPA: hypothetical protein [Caudoviricetes sp.]
MIVLDSNISFFLIIVSLGESLEGLCLFYFFY